MRSWTKCIVYLAMLVICLHSILERLSAPEGGQAAGLTASNHSQDRAELFRTELRQRAAHQAAVCAQKPSHSASR